MTIDIAVFWLMSLLVSLNRLGYLCIRNNFDFMRPIEIGVDIGQTAESPLFGSLAQPMWRSWWLLFSIIKFAMEQRNEIRYTHHNESIIDILSSTLDVSLMKRIPAGEPGRDLWDHDGRVWR